MREKLSLLIKAIGTIVFCTSTLVVLLTNTQTISAHDIKSTVGTAFADSIPSAADENGKAANLNHWIQNLPASWHSHLAPTTHNPID